MVRVSVAAVAAGCRSTGAAWTQGLISTAAQVRARLGILRSVQDAGRAVTIQSSSEEKIRLFRAMFCGREDVLAEENGIEYVEDNEEHGSSTLAWKWFFHAPWKYRKSRAVVPTCLAISVVPLWVLMVVPPEGVSVLPTEGVSVLPTEGVSVYPQGGCRYTPLGSLGSTLWGCRGNTSPPCSAKPSALHGGTLRPA